MTTSRKWIWWPSPSKKPRIEQKLVTVTDKGHVFVHPEKFNAKKADVVSATRVFSTKAEAHMAESLGGKLAWVYTDFSGSYYYRQDQDIKKIEVFQVRVQESYSDYLSAHPVDSHGKPKKNCDGISIRPNQCFTSKAKAQAALAEKVAEWLGDYESEMEQIKNRVALVMGARRQLIQDKVKIPTSAALKRRKHDRYKRQVAARARRNKS